MKTITGTVEAWVPSHGSLKDLAGDPSVALGNLGYAHPDQDMTTMQWTRVGSASITVTMRDEFDIVQDKIEVLRKEQVSIRAKAEEANTRIERTIQNLLAIGFDPEPAEMEDDEVLF